MLDDLINNSRLREEENGYHAAQHHHGNEVGCIGDHLHSLTEAFTWQIIQQQCKSNGDGNTDQKRVNTQRQGDSQQIGKFIAAKKPAEVFEVVPRATPNTQFSGVILKGDLHAIHGHIVKNNVIGQNWQNH